MVNNPVEQTDSGEVKRRALCLSGQAFEMHKRFHDRIQAELGAYGLLMPIKGLAEKAPEHACRLAATLAFADNQNAPEISGDHYVTAVALMDHYLSEALRLRHRKEPDDLRRRADVLLHWLKQRHAAGETQIDARTIQQKAPRSTGCRGSNEELLKVTEVLEKRGWLRRPPHNVKSKQIKGRTTWNIRCSHP